MELESFAATAIPWRLIRPRLSRWPTARRWSSVRLTREDVPAILKSVHPCLFIERDYYDIVSARLYGELLAWYRYRVKSEYCLLGQVDGYLVGIVNGRLENEKVGMSYHTLAIDRGLRIGSHLFAAKMEYHIDYLGQDEVLIVAESPIGFRRWMVEYPLEQTKIPHELGGGNSYRLTRESTSRPSRAWWWGTVRCRRTCGRGHGRDQVCRR